MTTESLFGNSPTVEFPDNAEDTYSMGTRVTFAVAGTITAVRFWGTTNAIVTSPFGAVYDTGGNLQVSKAAGAYVTSGWNTVTFDTPFSVAAGETWDCVVGPINRYAATTGVFPLTVGDLTGTQGRFVTGTSLAWPTSLSGGGATWLSVDVVFTPAPTTIDATLSATLAPLTAALAGDELFGGTLAAILSPLVAAFDGDERIDGSLAASLPALVAVFVDALPTGGGYRYVQRTPPGRYKQSTPPGREAA